MDRSKSFVVLGLGLALPIVLAVALLPPSIAGGVNAPHTVIVSDDPVDRTPDVLGNEDWQVMAITQIADRVFVGGKFKRVREAGGHTALRRPYLFAYDADTGEIDRGFRPRLDERVNAMDVAPNGQDLIIGGTFNSVAGSQHSNLARIDGRTGELEPAFETEVHAQVRDLVVRGDRLFIAGDFTQVEGEDRLGLAALDVVTGAVDPNLDIPFDEARRGSSPDDPTVRKIDVTPDGSKLVAIGNFTEVDGLNRTELAVLDLSASRARVADWRTDRWKPECPHEDSYIRDVDISPDGSYFVTVSIGFYVPPPALCDTAARWELDQTGSNVQPTWVDYTGGDSMISVAVTGTAVYVGGHQRWMNNPYSVGAAGPGGVEREGIAALDPVNGLPFSWNPGRDRGNGVFALYATSGGLFLGSDTGKLAGEAHGKLGFFPVAGGTPVPVAVPGPLPGQFYKVAYEDGVLQRRFYDGDFGPPTEVARGIDWSHVRGAFMLSGRLYTGWDDGRIYVRSFDGDTPGPAENLHATAFFSSEAQAEVEHITGMFFRRGRLYYTERGDSNLYYRYFTPESGVVGAQEFVGTRNDVGVNWGRIRGATLANERLYFSIEGSLYRVRFEQGRVIPGTKAPVSGPAAGDEIDWRARGLFVFSP
jgi:hypothetical protein